PDGSGPPLPFIPLPGRFIQMGAFSRITVNPALGVRLLPLPLQLFLGAVTVVGFALFQQAFDIRPINIQPLHTRIGPELSPHIRTLVPLQAQPFEPVDKALYGIGPVAAGIGILNSQDVLSAVLSGEQKVEQRRPRASDM